MQVNKDQASLQALVDTAVDGNILIDARGTVLLFNPACERLFGYGADEMIGRDVGRLLTTPFRDEHDELHQSDLRTGDREVEGRRKDGTRFPLHLSVGETTQSGERAFVWVLHDLTALRESQRLALALSAELLLALRTPATGQVSAATVAHELSEPLTAIGNFVDAARRMLTRGSAPFPLPVLEYMTKALGEVERACETIRSLRDLVDASPVERAPASLNVPDRGDPAGDRGASALSSSPR